MELRWEGKQKERKSELDEFEEETQPSLQRALPLNRILLATLTREWGWFQRGQTLKATSDGPTSHKDTSQHPAPC